MSIFYKPRQITFTIIRDQVEEQLCIVKKLSVISQNKLSESGIY